MNIALILWACAVVGVLWVCIWLAGKAGEREARQREILAYYADCMGQLNALRQREGWSVTFICDNPDFDNGPLCQIEVFGEWPAIMCTPREHSTIADLEFQRKNPMVIVWGSRVFRGELLLECLSNARVAAGIAYP